MRTPSDPSDDEIDHLLSRGGLGRQQKERVLGAVLASMPAPAPAARRRWWIWGGAGASLAAGFAVLVLWLHAPGRGGADLRDKGAAAGAPIVDLTCLGGSVDACPHGARVALSLEGGTGEAAFVSAYAQPIAGGERVWYLTNQLVAAADPGAPALPRVVPKGALIGAEHPPGRYRVEVVVSRRAVARADLARLAPGDLVTRVQFPLVVSP